MGPLLLHVEGLVWVRSRPELGPTDGGRSGPDQSWEGSMVEGPVSVTDKSWDGLIIDGFGPVPT